MEQLILENEPSTNKYDFEKTIKLIHDFLYANSQIKTPQKIIDELSKVLNALIFLEISEKKKFAINLSVDEVRSLKKFNPVDVAKVSKVTRNAFKKLKGPKSSEIILLSDKDIAYVALLLNQIPLSEKEKDYLGDALESIRTDWVKRHGGQFFTDQKVTNLAIDLLDFAPEKGEVFADICCGTGGFLIAAMKYSIKRLNRKLIDSSKIVSILEDAIFGHEIDKEVGTIANSTLSGLSKGAMFKNVAFGDSLDLVTLKNNGLEENSFDCLASNPPFGVKITIKDPHILENFDLAKTNYKLAPRAPDILLLERNIKMLKPGKGKLAIVLPYQLLSGPQASYVREWLLKESQILAIIDLPKETFQPHTGTKTALVILKRRNKRLKDISLKNDPDIFMSIPQHIGHDRRGNPVFKKNARDQITNEILCDIDDVRIDYNKFLKRQDSDSDISFSISASQVENDNQLRINAEFYSPKHSDNYFEQNETEFNFVQLKEIIKEISFPGRFKRNFVNKSSESVPFLGGANITQFTINTEKWFPKEDSKYEQLKVEKGWILITRSGTTGIVSSVPSNWSGFAISEHVIRVIPNEKKISGAYLLAFLKTDYAQKQIKKGVFGSVIDEITPEHLAEIIVPIPKDKALMKKISEKMEKAEKLRSEAMMQFEAGISEVDTLISRAFS